MLQLRFRKYAFVTLVKVAVHAYCTTTVPGLTGRLMKGVLLPKEGHYR